VLNRKKASLQSNQKERKKNTFGNATADDKITNMKRLLCTILLLQLFSFAESQRFVDVDSAKLLLGKLNSDEAKALLYADLSFTYAFLQIDSSIGYAQKAIRLAKQLQYKEGEAAGMFSYGWALWASGNYDKAIEAALRSLNLHKDLKNYESTAISYMQLSVLYREAGDYVLALKYGMQSKDLFEASDFPRDLTQFHPYTTIGSIFVFTNQIDSASLYLAKAYEREKSENFISGYTLNTLGNIEVKKKNYRQAMDYFHAVIPNAIKYKNYFDVANAHTFIANVYHETGNIDSSIWYAKEILSKPEFSIFKQGVRDAFTILAQDYRLKNNNDSALKYLELRVATNDSLFNKEKARAIQNLTFNEQLRQQEIEANRIRDENRLKLYAVFTLCTVFLVIGIILYRNNKAQQKANILLQQQKEKVETTLKTLESTQSQLIQSEKMASLGELTAGIAHEIQNPLNFVNNFSEINKELIEELKIGALGGHKEEVIAIANNIKLNEEKINHHGKRADAIVKGMLLHSKSSTGKKEPTDINALVDEYLRLAHHGWKAKDKEFNADIQKHYDPAIGKINIIPQDLGRVLLNVYNNAFYAISEKNKQQGYEPTISVSTKKIDSQVEIRVKDNGNGIPQKVKDKIFQPFFTTKPTGQGTGLGLSVSYDIIKAHGGELKVESKDGEGAEFVIRIPIA
jgi:two-component system NtrC family sensor kinase